MTFNYIYDIFNVYKSLNLETLIKVMDKLDKVLEGDLDEVIEALINEDQKRKLMQNED